LFLAQAARVADVAIDEGTRRQGSGWREVCHGRDSQACPSPS
jgi:hypothetical protein